MLQEMREHSYLTLRYCNLLNKLMNLVMRWFISVFSYMIISAAGCTCCLLSQRNKIICPFFP